MYTLAIAAPSVCSGLLISHERALETIDLYCIQNPTLRDKDTPPRMGENWEILERFVRITMRFWFCGIRTFFGADVSLRRFSLIRFEVFAERVLKRMGDVSLGYVGILIRNMIWKFFYRYEIYWTAHSNVESFQWKKWIFNNLKALWISIIYSRI